MKLLPVALNVQGARVLVIGGGAVAARKAGVLRECGASIHVIAPHLCAEMEAMQGELEYSARGFQGNDCENYNLIFACTDNPEVNAQIAAEAKAKNIWVQIADDAAGSTLHGAAAVRRDEICIGITTGGGSPALAKHLKKQVEDCIGDEYSQLLELMSAHRNKIKSQIHSQPARAQLWREVLDSGVLQLLRDGKQTEAENLLQTLIDQKLTAKS